jgi:hypothetical protein
VRAFGNLAGVEFIAPPMYHRDDALWREIITESGYFFTRSAMRFFNSQVAWDSLVKIDQDTYGFITSEKPDFGQRCYTVRKWEKESGVGELSEFRQFDTIAQAKTYLMRGGFVTA